ncbi:MAG: S8 family serine peptidase [bacterium]|nr:S8 family serine peptidase [bacterium]
MTRIFLALLATLVLATSAQAGDIAPGLQDILDGKNADETVSVLVYMAEKAPIAQLTEELRSAKASRKQRHSVIVSTLQDVAENQKELLSELSTQKLSGEVVGYTSYWISNLMVVEATPAVIYRIADRLDVEFVESNFEVELIEPIHRGNTMSGDDSQAGSRSIGITNGLTAINADRVWYELGITGNGRIVGSLDTGVDGSHVALANSWRGQTHSWQESWHDVVGAVSQFPVDYNSHGTHTTGTMAGVAANDTIGVAWGSQWIAANAIDQGAGGGFTNDIIDCLQWFTDPDGNPETIDDVPDAVCNSWGVTSNMGYPACYSYWYTVIDNCEAAGVVTVWATGNEGPSGSSVRSPANRATTTTNSFSVGSVNANGSYPYSISSFSSRGPSQCSAPAPNLIKPEVSAPGQGVYSSVPGGYSNFDGTSMATPHVAGVVALMREAAPNIEVDTIKQILMDSAHDFGTSGEDNLYGWGFIDAYEAVSQAMQYSYGQFVGQVTNGSFGGGAISGATVTLTNGRESFEQQTNSEGNFSIYAPDGTYTVSVQMDGFASGQSSVQLSVPNVETEDFALLDNQGPVVTDVLQPLAVSTEDADYPITAAAYDHSSVLSASLHYRVNNGAWTELPMSFADGLHEAAIPNQGPNSTVDYFVSATDGINQVGYGPSDAPTSYFTLLVSTEIYSYTVENPEDNEWQLGVSGDEATAGLWERGDPEGTSFGGIIFEPADDHTPDPGVMCFVTGIGQPGGSALASDLDGGCTTLLSPVFDLSEVEFATAKYWRWYSEGGATPDDEFVVDVSEDGGETWVEIERIVETDPQWVQVVVDLNQLINFTDQVVFRFTGCDENSLSVVEAAIDDFSIMAFTPQTTPVPGGNLQPAVVRLAQNHPNPFNPSTTISFELPGSELVELEIYSVDGRRIATLVSEPMSAGAHKVAWNGRNDQGQMVASGTYFYRLQTGSQTLSRRMVLLK